jgi:hypothetical protein
MMETRHLMGRRCQSVAGRERNKSIPRIFVHRRPSNPSIICKEKRCQPSTPLLIFQISLKTKMMHPSKILWVTTSLVLSLLPATTSAFTTPQKYGIGTSPLVSSGSYSPSNYLMANHNKKETRLIQMSDTSVDGGSMEKKKGFIGRVCTRRFLQQHFIITTF